jgi:nucleoside 2-deoxyribosyltransferase
MDPGLRASGITHERDIRAFDRALVRCRSFGIEVCSLPCPETLFLGRDRQPATYSERLATPDFGLLLDRLEQEVRSMINTKGSPFAIVGVDSSPTCGVTRTWRSPAGREPGRGVFLERFLEIPVYDVFRVAAFRIYLAGPLFSEAERSWNLKIAEYLRSYAYDVYLPQEIGDSSASRGVDAHQEIFTQNHAALDESDIIVAVIDGADADSGTAWEIGYAYARGIPVYAIRTDFRMVGATEQVNLMLEQSAVVTHSLKDLCDALPCPLPVTCLSSRKE